ncbi:MAG: MFS transporter [Armatimonadetes bacterium]|nr:MFS transporter [Armatimonadota bacterium]
MSFPAFSHRNFRLFWTGNAISLVGSLAQEAARGWLVRTLTPDPFTIAAVAACNSVPILFLTLYAGALADRVDKKRGLILTNALAMTLAVMLAVLTYTGAITVIGVAVISLLVGVVSAFDIPIRQSMNVEMVGREDLPNAIALNSTAFNGARVAGPALGGFLIHAVGMAGCFALNALSFLALIFNLRRMDLPPSPKSKGASGLSEIREGFAFVRGHEVLWPTTILVAVCSFFALSFSSLLPVFAKDVLGSDARGFSLLLSSSGAGALFSAGSLAVAGRMRHKGKRLLGGALAFCGCVAGFAYAPNLIAACVWLFASGFCLLTFLTTANTLVQTLAPDELRGRVFSLYSLALIGAGPLGALWTGAVAKFWGPRAGVALGAAIAALWAIGTYWKCRALWKEK